MRREKAGVEQAVPVIRTLLRAHLAAYQTLHRVAAERHAQANVGITWNTLAFAPLRDWAPLDRLTARSMDQAWNWDFLDAIHSGLVGNKNSKCARGGEREYQ